MDRAQEELLVSLVCWGRNVMTRTSLSGQQTRYILRPPTPAENAKSQLVFRSVVERSDLLSETEMLALAIASGQWSDDEESKLKSLIDDIRNLKRGLLDYLYQKDKLEVIRTAIRRAESLLSEVWLKKQNILSTSAVGQATMTRQRYLVGRTTLDESGQQVWPTEADFDNETDAALIHELTRFCFEASRLTPAQIRALARGEVWRPIWVAGKLTNSFFDGLPMAWSDSQRDLVYWSRVYDNVAESMDRPSDEVIDDDDLLDSWLIRQADKAKEETNKRETEAILKLKGKTRPGAREEVFIPTSRDGARKIYGLNDTESRIKLQARQKIVDRHGAVAEQQMPDSQQDMRTQLARMQADRIKR